MSDKITEETVRGLVNTGLEKGTVSTDFGPAVVRTALIKGVNALTVTFPDFMEKWAVVEGVIQGVKFNPADHLMAVVPIAPKTTVVKKEEKDEEYNRLMSEIEAGEGKVIKGVKELNPKPKPIRSDPLDRKVEKMTEKKGGLTEQEKQEVRKKMEPIAKIMQGLKQVRKIKIIPTTNLVAPRAERPKTKVAKEKKAGVMKEQPPTKRAYEGRPPDKAGKGKVKGTQAIKGQGSITKVAVKVPVKVDKRTGPVPKIGPKAPKWVRQLGYNGKPEKVDLNLYPVKVVCGTCGQVRYVDRKNAGNKSHPVMLCKPCQLRKKNDVHNAKLRARTVARQKALEEAATARLDKLVAKKEAWSRSRK